MSSAAVMMRPGSSLDPAAPHIEGPPGSRAPGQDAACRESLFFELQPLIRRLVARYADTIEQREDLQGEIYCRFHVLFDLYDPTRGVPLRPYMIRQLSAAAYTYARTQWSINRRERSLESEIGPSVRLRAEDPAPGWLERIATEQVARALPDAIMKLPDRQRKVLIWRYYDEKSFEEIAAQLKIQPATARSLLRHGIASLRRRICGTAGCEH